MARLGSAVLVLAALFAPPASADVARVAAASDLSFALEEIAAAFARETGHETRLTFGSSGNLARQIREGAPFDLFLSADESYVALLEKAGRTDGAGTPYAIGRIVVFAPAGSPVGVDAELAGVRSALAAGRLKRLAIANPDHAPYGRAAREALEHAGAWALARPRLALGENVSQAAQFALTGSVDAAIIAYSLVLTPAFRDKGTHALLPEHMHAPLRQRMVLLKGAGTAARELYVFIGSAKARPVLERYGFGIPAR
ncbi:MAG TPA: molybdate ABC transporter substrate-binding protein [Burkholderiales bacterium]|nr:molybdate ABC transporter substrate-binding protein [Burkholderiales bacterium]